MILTVKDLVTNRNVCFQYYRKGELWYQVVGTSFVFPVPIEDTGDGTFAALDKAILFMRYIRKYHAALKAEQP